MSALWAGKDIAAATGGKLTAPFKVSGLSIDTRSLKEGELFIPLVDQRDGHDFVPMAFEKGAAGVLSARQIADVPAVQVSDTLAALRGMAVASRKRSKARRIAVTGSVGKTSVKEMVAAMLSSFGPCHKSQKSFNNHWGAPLTLASMPKATKYGVFELGMNHAGELSELTALIKPHIAIITKIAPAHLENFDNMDGIADAKAEIFEGVKPGGVAILSEDDAYFARLSNAAKDQGLKLITIGQAKGDVRWSSDGLNAVFTIGKRHYSARLAQSGEHAAYNAAIALAVAKAVGLSVSKALKIIAKQSAPAGRGETFKSRAFGHSVTVIDESYNANPESMKAAILAAGLRKGRRIAVLGDMKEIGPQSAQFHAGLASHLNVAGFQKVITIGEDSAALQNALPQDMQAGHVADHDAVWTALQNISRKGDIILIKASNSVGLGHIAKGLKKGER